MFTLEDRFYCASLNQTRGTFHIIGGKSVIYGFGDQPLVLIPRTGSPVQGGHLFGQCLLQTIAQQISE